MLLREAPGRGAARRAAPGRIAPVVAAVAVIGGAAATLLGVRAIAPPLEPALTRERKVWSAL